MALVPAVDATIADLVGQSFYSKAQNNQFIVAAVKFNMYWASRRLTNYPMGPETVSYTHLTLPTKA